MTPKDKDATIARLSEQVNTLITEKHADAEVIGALRDALAEVTAERDDWKARYFRMRDERDKAQIAPANYASFNHEWRQRAEAAEVVLAKIMAERDEWKDEYKTAEKGLNVYRKANVKVIAERDAARAKGFAQGIEAAVKWAKEGYKCQTCGKRFLASDNHEVSECSSGYPSWGRIEMDELADTIRALSPIPPVDVNETPVRERQEGLTLTDDPQAQPTDNTALVEALEAMLHAVCGETGFAACVRLDSGLAYPWPALDAAEEKAQSVLRALKSDDTPAASSPGRAVSSEPVWLDVTARPQEAPTPPVDVNETPVHERQAGLMLTDATQADPANIPSPEEILDLIGEFGREVFYLLDDCETSGPVGEEVHTITGESLKKVSDLLDRIDALPFEEPDCILGPGAMLQEAVKRTFSNQNQQPDPVREAAQVLLDDDISLSKMAEAVHDGPLGADDHRFSAATKQGAWCLDVVRAALRALAQKGGE